MNPFCELSKNSRIICSLRTCSSCLTFQKQNYFWFSSFWEKINSWSPFLESRPPQDVRPVLHSIPNFRRRTLLHEIDFSIDKERTTNCASSVNVATETTLVSGIGSVNVGFEKRRQRCGRGYKVLFFSGEIFLILTSFIWETGESGDINAIPVNRVVCYLGIRYLGH